MRQAIVPLFVLATCWCNVGLFAQDDAREEAANPPELRGDSNLDRQVDDAESQNARADDPADDNRAAGRTSQDPNYKFFQGRWWYRTQNGNWLYWQGNRWVQFNGGASAGGNTYVQPRTQSYSQPQYYSQPRYYNSPGYGYGGGYYGNNYYGGGYNSGRYGMGYRGYNNPGYGYGGYNGGYGGYGGYYNGPGYGNRGWGNMNYGNRGANQGSNIGGMIDQSFGGSGRAGAAIGGAIGR